MKKAKGRPILLINCKRFTGRWSLLLFESYSSSWTTSIFPDLTAAFRAAWSRPVWSA